MKHVLKLTMVLGLLVSSVGCIPYTVSTGWRLEPPRGSERAFVIRTISSAQYSVPLHWDSHAIRRNPGAYYELVNLIPLPRERRGATWWGWMGYSGVTRVYRLFDRRVREGGWVPLVHRRKGYAFGIVRRGKWWRFGPLTYQLFGYSPKHRKWIRIGNLDPKRRVTAASDQSDFQDDFQDEY